jgi:hypothetical protein
VPFPEIVTLPGLGMLRRSLVQRHARSKQMHTLQPVIPANGARVTSIHLGLIPLGKFGIAVGFRWFAHDVGLDRNGVRSGPGTK